MRISITKNQYELLTKRNAATEKAQNALATASVAANLAKANFDALDAAMSDCIASIVADSHIAIPLQKLKPVSFNRLPDGETFELELSEDSTPSKGTPE